MPYNHIGMKSWFQGYPIFEHPKVYQSPASLSQVRPSILAYVGHARGKLSASVGHVERK